MCPILYDKFSPIESSHTVTIRIRRYQSGIIPLLVLILPGCGQNQAGNGSTFPSSRYSHIRLELEGLGFLLCGGVPW